MQAPLNCRLYNAGIAKLFNWDKAYGEGPICIQRTCLRTTCTQHNRVGTFAPTRFQLSCLVAHPQLVSLPDRLVRLYNYPLSNKKLKCKAFWKSYWYAQTNSRIEKPYVIINHVPICKRGSKLYTMVPSVTVVPFIKVIMLMQFYKCYSIAILNTKFYLYQPYVMN